ncbi:MAG: tRNA uridine-5-carboxymethylaminomethyl(34) synthesis enzyme MnmG [Opitutales bacterium]|nr:tRNA uridine-5-carboxymethylaminomethyl(34) synthesis enzyme MnmG [Opitutales bacterium]
MKKEIRISEQKPYDVIVVGAGHAGVEAALAAARMGADTLLLTGNLDTISKMSCNPAIGGQAKGHIVREIDALGGEMAVCADATAIQFRVLNASKGPSVQSPRAQCDKLVYSARMKCICEIRENITLFQAVVTGLVFKSGKVVGVKTSFGVNFYGKTVVVTTGTFLKGKMFIGSNVNFGGRLGDFNAETLSDSFLKAGIKIDRLKTGTPARILGSSIDFSCCEEQKGDENPVFFAFYDTRDTEDMFHVEHIKIPGWAPGSNKRSCWLADTGENTGVLIKDNIHSSPLYSGLIHGVGARYCPSIEDKFVRFPDKDKHRLFLEPEGLYSDEWYINGFSTSLPFPVQLDMIRSVPALKNAVMLRPAYAIEYDYAPPTQLLPSLETKNVENLFFAGQINGTSGYEEAAIQGLIAGVNAASRVLGRKELVIGRDEAYGGVLIDDLVTKGTQEPYRMFTSRAEYRLLFNHGSAELRLVDKIEDLGLLSDSRLSRIKKKKALVEHWCEMFEKLTIKGGIIGDVLRKDINSVPPALPDGFNSLDSAIQEEVLYRVRYKGYLSREQKSIERMKNLESFSIPDSFDYNTVSGLRIESRQKLISIRPKTLAQAERISGVNPADISLLMVFLSSLKKK